MTIPEASSHRSIDFQPRRLQARDGAGAMLTPYGAHLLSWTPAPDFRERLFLSERSEYRPGAAIRGGVPVIFPQFAAEGPLPKHGFARTAVWSLQASGERTDGMAWMQFVLQDSPATRAVWPHAFQVSLTASVGGVSLDIALRVRNTGASQLQFTAALHSYFRVADVGAVTIRGLCGLDYRDSADGGQPRRENASAVHLEGEVDRIYFDARQSIEVVEGNRRLSVAAAGFPDCVVWNPGATKAAALADLDTGGFRRFVCVESAAINNPVALDPGESWEGVQRLLAA